MIIFSLHSNETVCKSEPILKHKFKLFNILCFIFEDLGFRQKTVFYNHDFYAIKNKGTKTCHGNVHSVGAMLPCGLWDYQWAM